MPDDKKCTSAVRPDSTVIQDSVPAPEYVMPLSVPRSVIGMAETATAERHSAVGIANFAMNITENDCAYCQ